jgi:hypothetical protein
LAGEGWKKEAEEEYDGQMAGNMISLGATERYEFAAT